MDSLGKVLGLLAAKTGRRTGRSILDDLKRLAEADAVITRHRAIPHHLRFGEAS